MALFEAVTPLAGQQRALTTAQIARLATPATVTIFAIDSQGDTVGLGSGFIISADGVIVTNYHVMAGATSAAVLLATGERYPHVTGLAGDHDADVALIKIPAAGLPVLRTNNKLPALGTRIVAVGSPLGLSQTVSDGIVSGRRILEGRELMQMSAPISPGSSGGPVLNEAGEVVAISTLYLAKGQALNFAVPVRYAIGILRPQPLPGNLALAEVFGASGDPQRDSSSPSADASALRAQAEAVIAQADSARYLLCLSAFLLEKSRIHMDSVRRQVALSRLVSVTAVTMTAIVDATIPEAELHLTRLRLAEVSRSTAGPRDSALAALSRAHTVLAGARQRIDYRGNPTVGDLDGIASTTLEVATIMDREYVRARGAFLYTPPPDSLPACLDGSQRRR